MLEVHWLNSVDLLFCFNTLVSLRHYKTWQLCFCNIIYAWVFNWPILPYYLEEGVVGLFLLMNIMYMSRVTSNCEGTTTSWGVKLIKYHDTGLYRIQKSSEIIVAPLLCNTGPFGLQYSIESCVLTSDDAPFIYSSVLFISFAQSVL